MAKSIFWQDTAEDLARAVLSLAQVGGMPDSYWYTDSRITLACSILGISKEEAAELDWWVEI
jgi:hypothetical protein